MGVDVSVIIPVYNVEKYLKQCLDSVLHQSFQNFEMIVVNDGSTDGSGEIIEQYVEKYSEKIITVSQSNRGISATRNRALRMAKGKYIVFVDSDDYIGQDYIKVLYQEAEKSCSDMVICNYTRVSAEGEILKSFEANYVNEDMRIPSYVLWNRIIRKELFCKYELFFREGIICEDVPLILQLETVAKNIKTISISDYYYRCNPKSITSTFKKKKYRMDQLPFQALEESVNFCLSYNPPMDKEKLEFFFCRIFTSLIFDIGRGCEKTVRKGMCNEVAIFMNKYFQGYFKNKYVKINSLKNLHKIQKWGTWIFVHALQFHLLGPVSFICSHL